MTEENRFTKTVIAEKRFNKQGRPGKKKKRGPSGRMQSTEDIFSKTPKGGKLPPDNGIVLRNALVKNEVVKKKGGGETCRKKRGRKIRPSLWKNAKSQKKKMHAPGGTRRNGSSA